MKSFSVLDRTQPIDRHFLIEASAGTGKTFAIENSVVRLLIENEIPLEEILVVTFTRAATRDLKLRIRSNIEKAIHCFRHEDKSVPDYIAAIQEKGSEAVVKAVKQLEKALFTFDQAHIFTIHGFCARALKDYLFEGDFSAAAIGSEETFSDHEMIGLVQDFLRTELHENAYSNEQKKILSQEYGHSLEKLIHGVVTLVKSNRDIKEIPDFSQHYEQFCYAMQKIKLTNLNPEHIVDDFLAQVPFYEKLVGRNRKVKPEFLEKVLWFANLFEQNKWEKEDFERLIEEGLFLTEALHPSRLKQSVGPLPTLHYPFLFSLLQTELAPLVAEARLPQFIVSRIARGCQQLLQTYLTKEEKLNFDHLIRKMKEALQHPDFVASIQKTYRAVIIDEFQDTDPNQWHIFRTLFLDTPILILVGDPKQSIYAFRQGDIYTYLSARDTLGKEQCVSLDTNYRSHIPLISALNTLFSAASHFIALPRIQEALLYHPVKSHVKAKSFSDDIGSLHFCMINGEDDIETKENKFLFPYFAQEIARLHSKENIPLSEFAILVSDRFQGQRVAKFLQENGIPVLSQRTESLTASPMLPALRELLEAILHPHRESALKTALGGKIVKWNHEEVRNCNESTYESLILQCHSLRQTWFQEGFVKMFSQLMKSTWHPSCASLHHHMLLEENGLDDYEDLHHFAELLIQHEYLFQCSPNGLLSYLDHLLTQENDEPLNKRQDPTKNGVNILTLHSSKGLEFDIVFTPGLIMRNKATDLIIPDSKTQLLTPVIDKDHPLYRAHCEEVDAEKMRQFYVALTRARYRVYVPVTPWAEPAPLGRASPMELFLTHLKTELRDFVAQHAKTFLTLSDLQTIQTTHFSLSNDCFDNLLPPPSVSLSFFQPHILSFSSLTANNPLLTKASQQASTEKNSHTLPAGSETGILLHTILEHISFTYARSLANPEQLHSFIQPYVQNTPFEPWLHTISHIIFHTLHVPLPFRICDVSDSDCYRECEFLYKTPQGDFMTGFIDLLFRFHDRYYIVDWKSNWLGPTQEDYNQENLIKAVQAHQYDLQARIYADACKLYLKQIDPRPFEEIWGGAFTLFLRGLDSRQNDSPGIFVNTLMGTQNS